MLFCIHSLQPQGEWGADQFFCRIKSLLRATVTDNYLMSCQTPFSTLHIHSRHSIHIIRRSAARWRDTQTSRKGVWRVQATCFVSNRKPRTIRKTSRFHSSIFFTLKGIYTRKYAPLLCVTISLVRDSLCSSIHSLSSEGRCFWVYRGVGIRVCGHFIFWL